MPNAVKDSAGSSKQILISKCRLEGCERRIHAKGHCEPHYRRLRKRGSTGPTWIWTEATPEQRFWRFVHQRPEQANACWLWQGATGQGGYGVFQVARKRVYAHRFAYELARGPILEGLTIDHLCETAACIRASHLEPVTLAENTRRRHARERERVA